VNTPDPDGDVVRDALEAAVSGVEPVDRLAAIQARTARPSRRGWYVAAGAVLAAAAVVVTVAVVPPGDPDRGGVPAGDAGSPTTTQATTQVTDNPPPARARAIYYVGDTPDGPALFREFQLVAHDPSEQTVALATTPSADDPDYRTLWPTELHGVSFDRVGEDWGWAVVIPDELTRRPTGMSETEAVLAVQQVVYTIQAFSRTTTGVRFLTSQGYSLTVLGVRVPQGGVMRDPDVLADVSISDPTEARTVTGSFTARGVADSFEATVPWRVLDSDGAVVVSGTATAGGFGRLSAWKARIDVSALPPGTYTFEASTFDPSGGEGPGATVDTRSITVT
jgi:hypothetical protein